jgi:hypothetical protein
MSVAAAEVSQLAGLGVVSRFCIDFRRKELHEQGAMCAVNVGEIETSLHRYVH